MRAANQAILDMGAAGLEPLVAAAAARALRLPPEIVGPDVPFARLGLDSLGCLELAAELETALGIHVPADAVVECTTVRSLCATLSGGAPQPAFERMRADARLVADLRPRPFIGAQSLADARQVLLTGATGFLGSALLDILLQRTQAHVTCLARPKPGVRSALRPLEGARSQNLRSGTSDRRNADLTPDRVDVVHGDLTRPRAGLSDRDWTQLVARTDAVCHVGASINWIAGYDALRDVNVLATHEMLKLAAEAGASFHFISSASVCYSTTGPRTVDEHHDPLDAVEGLHFGYAQSKAVAESLVRQAGALGMRTRIYRPAMISGHSLSGRFNPDDMLSKLIAGCVRMGAAPDLDWSLDALPVDNVAELILALSGGASSETAWHLAHPRPRHWRECVLWMRLYGYDVTLLPYREWTQRLHQAADQDHPLRPLRSFFLDARSDGLTIPELHEQSRAPRLDTERTSAAIEREGMEVTPLDAELMDRYFAAFVEEGVLPPPARQRVLRHDGLDAAALGVRPFAAGHSIISELTAWQSGGSCGLYRLRGPGGRGLVLKVLPHADDVRTVGEALAGICGERLGEAYREFGSGLGIEGSHEREVALYRDADPVTRAHMPVAIATHADANARAWAVLIEDLSGARLLDSVDHPGAWTLDDIGTAIDGIAAVHGAWHERVDDLRTSPWMAPTRTTGSMVTMTPLWRALADHAVTSTGGALAQRQHALIDRIAEWRPVLDAAPQTLVHNDFNPRNICLKPFGDGWRLCAYDWELAAIGTPARDLAELLCFLAPVGITRASVEGLIDPHVSHAAFASALAELLVDRLSVYAMIHRVRPQRFLPRVLRTWSHLHSLFPVHGVSG
jgi:thioester reductase-like protein